MSFDVLFDSGKRENLEGPQVRIPAKCFTCGRPKGTVPSWEKGKDLVTATKRGNLPVVMQMTESGADLEVRGTEVPGRGKRHRARSCGEKQRREAEARKIERKRNKKGVGGAHC